MSNDLTLAEKLAELARRFAEHVADDLADMGEAIEAKRAEKGGSGFKERYEGLIYDRKSGKMLRRH